jgi:HEAT repeat protein
VKKLRAFGLLTLLGVPLFAVLIPQSPYYLANWFNNSPRYQGRSARSWVKALDNPEPQARYRAIFALGAMGPEGGEGVPALAQILVDDPDGEARHQAAFALSKMAPASGAAVSALAQALSDEEPYVRVNAALALSRLRTEARPAIPALIKALDDKGNRARVGQFFFTIHEAVVLALGRASAGSDEAVPALTRLLRAKTPAALRRATVQALGEVGPEARPAVRHLRPLLEDSDPEVRHAAEEALRKIGARPGRAG